MVVEDPESIDAMTKFIYPSVAKKHQTRPSLVQSAICSAISATWDKSNIGVLNSYFGCTTSYGGKPTNSEFIAMIAVHVQLEQESDPLNIHLAKIMRQIGVPANIKGYRYLCTAILLTVENPDIINSVTQVLYPSVAKKYATTTSRVECAIRHAIEVAWDRGDIATLNSYFGCTIQNNRGKPTSSEFIAMIADNLRLKYKLY